MSDPWLTKHTKSVLTNTTITVMGCLNNHDVPIKLTIEAIELDYGPVINLKIISDTPYFEDAMLSWSDHPFQWVDKNYFEDDNSVGNIIDSTPATRALINELANPEPYTLYTTTDCTHRGRIIGALNLFWS